MASLAFYASPFDSPAPLKEDKPAKPKSDGDVRALIAQIHEKPTDAGGKSGMGEFKPPEKPVLTKIPATQGVPGDTHGGPVAASTHPDISNSSPSSVGAANTPQRMLPPWHPQAAPAAEQTRLPKDELLKKINYMIHLLEEQKDVRTGHVTEELILYSFLGVFVIFVVDSFARAGKYVRELN